jgi:hypothetical protein
MAVMYLYGPTLAQPTSLILKLENPEPWITKITRHLIKA